MPSKNLNIAKSITPVDLTPPHLVADKEAAKAKLKDLMKEESRLVKGIFQSFESPGASVKISVRKYPGVDKGGIPFFEKIMTDGETYEIPLYVARHLNGIDVTAGALGDPGTRNANIGTCSYAVHGFKMPEPHSLRPSYLGEGGIPVPIVGVVKRTKRYGFQSLEFASGDVV